MKSTNYHYYFTYFSNFQEERKEKRRKEKQGEEKRREEKKEKKTSRKKEKAKNEYSQILCTDSNITQKRRPENRNSVRRLSHIPASPYGQPTGTYQCTSFNPTTPIRMSATNKSLNTLAES